MCVQERSPALRWKEQMGGGSGLLCLRTTVALRIRVPPTFHPGPQLPTTAHGARPAPAHHGPAPRAICLLGQTTPLLSPPSQHCVLASLLLRHATRIPKTEKTGPTVTWVLHVAFWSSGETEGIRRDDSKGVKESQTHLNLYIKRSDELLMLLLQCAMDHLVLRHLFRSLQAQMERTTEFEHKHV